MMDNCRIAYFAGWVCFAACLVAYGVFLGFNSDHVIDSDVASEVVLSNMIAQDGQLLRTDWFYSTELRIVNMQLVFAPLFAICGDWHVVYISGCLICLVVLLASLYFLCSSMGFKRAFPWMAVLFALPVSWPYGSYVLRCPYYTFHIVAAFVAMGVVFRLAQAPRMHSARSLALLSLSGLLALAISLASARMMVVLYLPLLATAFIVVIVRRETATLRIFVSAAIVFAAALIGLLLNQFVLSGIFSFRQYDSVRLVSPSLDRLISFAECLLSCFGYSSSYSVLSWRFLVNVFSIGALILFIVALIDSFRRLESSSAEIAFLAVFLAVALVGMGLIRVFTDMQFNARYLLSIVALAVPLVVSFLLKSPILGARRVRACAALVICVMVVFCGTVQYRTMQKTDFNFDLDLPAKALQAQGYTAGYSSFHNGNAVTHLTNGQIEMWVFTDTWTDKRTQISGLDQVYRWLQKASHVDEKPDRAFVLFSRYELETQEFAKRFANAKPIYEDSKHIAYDVSDIDA